MQPLLDLKHIKRYYQSGDTVVKALDDASLQIYPGEFVAIMGQSGSGKSTMMNIIGCLDKPTSGTYHIMGRDASQLESDDLAALRRETFGFIFQRYNLLTNASAEENVEIPAMYAGLDATSRRTRARELLTQLGLGERLKNRPGQMSGGQQQRVAIARALMNNPPAILADEPTGALDSRSGAEVMALLKDLHAQGRTIILITHDEHVASHAHRIIRLADGHIIEDSGPNPSQNIKATRGGHGVEHDSLIPEIGESIRTAMRALRVNLFRTALTLLGIIIGVAAVVTMLAVGEGSKQKVLTQISNLGTNILNIRPGAPGIRPSGDIVTLIPDDARAILEMDNVEVVVPERSGRKTLRYGNNDYAANVQGVGKDFTIARDWPVKTGNFFMSRDIESYSAVVVLGTTVAGALFPGDDNPIGKFVLIGNIPFEVIGILSSKGAAPWGGDQDDAAFVPFTT
ncbi:MAG TPA: ABC transporter permease, partial [Alphaproteobacteria bacterium]